MLTLFVRAVMCNWMVSTGVIGAMISTTVPGKVIAMWMPITVFFFMTFEHSVVNMFLFPSALIMGGNFSVMDYLIWNEIPDPGRQHRRRHRLHRADALLDPCAPGGHARLGAPDGRGGVGREGVTKAVTSM